MTMTKTDRRLLIVEDDEAFARTLVRSFERRGYQVRHLTGDDGMPALLEDFAPTHAVVDLKLAGGASGLSSVKQLHAFDPDLVIVVLTGYASIATEAREQVDEVGVPIGCKVDTKGFKCFFKPFLPYVS